jgi:hypothetical protein
MRNATLPFLLLAFAGLFSSCTKETEAVLPAVIPGLACGSDGARLEATIAGTDWCPNATLFASEGAGVLTISGIDTQGRTVTLELTAWSVGEHPMTEDVNHLLHTTAMGLAYRTTDGDPGTLTITMLDEAERRIRGNFSAQIYEPLGGTAKGITGNFDLHYVQ